eukprot:TRINITY_DN30849_c0_g1_i1.p1 TRINITY_DN30849_c0_g1~~TRINITY_DN30849_c0_g1_i1.p1  ORF type:complete len:211 (-),score=35.44 TRINITY_DN30849_c0_g1_i1:194-826(-)
MSSTWALRSPLFLSVILLGGGNGLVFGTALVGKSSFVASTGIGTSGDTVGDLRKVEELLSKDLDEINGLLTHLSQDARGALVQPRWIIGLDGRAYRRTDETPITAPRKQLERYTVKHLSETLGDIISNSTNSTNSTSSTIVDVLEEEVLALSPAMQAAVVVVFCIVAYFFVRCFCRCCCRQRSNDGLESSIQEADMAEMHEVWIAKPSSS